MPSWPHAPPHCIHTAGIYMVTCGTYLKSHFFRSEENLCLLHNTFLQYAKEANWILHAWAVFSNHYHFVGESSKDSEPLTQWLGSLHRMTAIKVNERDNVTGRKVWYQYWDTHITIHKSYLARLHYVHQNPVKHGLVLTASQYPWCSAATFEMQATPSFVKTVYSFKTDKIKVFDEF